LDDEQREGNGKVAIYRKAFGGKKVLQYKKSQKLNLGKSSF
jgi:hypothetical protein